MPGHGAYQISFMKKKKKKKDCTPRTLAKPLPPTSDISFLPYPPPPPPPLKVDVICVSSLKANSTTGDFAAKLFCKEISETYMNIFRTIIDKTNMGLTAI